MYLSSSLTQLSNWLWMKHKFHPVLVFFVVCFVLLTSIKFFSICFNRSPSRNTIIKIRKNAQITRSCEFGDKNALAIENMLSLNHANYKALNTVFLNILKENKYICTHTVHFPSVSQLFQEKVSPLCYSVSFQHTMEKCYQRCLFKQSNLTEHEFMILCFIYKSAEKAPSSISRLNT